MAGEWVRSSTCSANSCIEVSPTPDTDVLAIRETAGEVASRLYFYVTRESFRAFIEGAKNGDFDSLL